MKTTVCAIGGRRVTVDKSYLQNDCVLLTIDASGGLASFAGIDYYGAVILGQALLDLAQKIEDDKLCPAAITSGINWQEVNDIARGNV